MIISASRNIAHQLSQHRNKSWPRWIIVIIDTRKLLRMIFLLSSQQKLAKIDDYNKTRENCCELSFYFLSTRCPPNTKQGWLIATFLVASAVRELYRHQCILSIRLRCSRCGFWPPIFARPPFNLLSKNADSYVRA